MADTFAYDDHEVRELARDLGRIPVKVVPAVEAVMKKGANNVKNTMRKDASGHPHFPHFPRSISYDRKLGTGIEYEIGPDKDRAGTGAPLANLLYFGSSRNAPVLDIEVGIRNEAPRLEKHLGEVAVDLLGL